MFKKLLNLFRSEPKFRPGDKVRWNQICKDEHINAKPPHQLHCLDQLAKFGKSIGTIHSLDQSFTWPDFKHYQYNIVWENDPEHYQSFSERFLEGINDTE